MNKEILERNLDIYNEIINRVDKFNPEHARVVYNKINFIIFTVANFYRLKAKMKFKQPQNLCDVFESLISIEFLREEEFLYIKEFLNENSDVLSNVFDIVNEFENSYDIFDLYEEVIALDIKVIDNHYSVVKENKHRDRTGAYYTSKEFARIITRKTIGEYLSKKCNCNVNEARKKLEKGDKDVINILKTSTYTDLSCGTGHFIISLIEYIEEFIHDEKIIDEILMNIYGFDIDIIAMQILKTQIILHLSNKKYIKDIKLNFTIGNTLLDNNEINYLERIDLIFKGYIYHSKLGINQKEYEEKFDVILGNPPWEKVRFEDKNFFANYCPRIAKINKKNIREKEIEDLEVSNPKLKRYYDIFIEELESSKKQIKKNMKLKESSSGELNTYALFTELALRFLNKDGCIALIVKSGLITTTVNSKIFNYLVDNNYIFSLDDFINKNKIFPIDSRERFTVIILKKTLSEKIKLKMMLENIEDLEENNFIEIDREILRTINPETNMIPNISSREELELLIKFYSKFKTFDYEFPNCKFGRLVHLTNHAKYIDKKNNEKNLPIYEGKFIEMYDNKFSTFKDMSEEDKYKSKASARLMEEDEKISSIPESRYFIDKEKWNDITKNYKYNYSIMWRSLTSATNRRTMIASILPHCPTIQSIQLLQNEDYKTQVLILSLFNSCIFDYLIRLKLNGIDLTQTVIKQIPVPAIEKFSEEIWLRNKKNSIENHIIERVASLYNNDDRLKEMFEYIVGMKLDNKITQTKKEIMLELDYIISQLYELSKEELISIMKTFKKEYTDKDILFIKSI